MVASKNGDTTIIHTEEMFNFLELLEDPNDKALSDFLKNKSNRRLMCIFSDIGVHHSEKFLKRDTLVLILNIIASIYAGKKISPVDFIPAKKVYSEVIGERSLSTTSFHISLKELQKLGMIDIEKKITSKGRESMIRLTTYGATTLLLRNKDDK